MFEKVKQFFKLEKKSINVNNDIPYGDFRGFFQDNSILNDSNFGWNYKSRNRIAESMASTEFFYKNSKKEIEEDKMFCDLMQKPNSYQNWDDFIYLCGMHITSNYGFAPILLDRLINPTEMIVLPPKSLIYSDEKNYKLSYKLNGKSISKTIEKEFIKIIKKPSLYAIDEAQGISVFLNNEINLEKRADELKTSSFVNRGRLGTYLTTKESLSDSVMERMEKRLNAKQQGTKKSFLTRIFDNGIQVNESNINNKDLQATEITKEVQDRILSAYSISDIALGRESASSNATSLVANKVFFTNSVYPYLNKISFCLNNDIIPLFVDYKKGDYVDFDKELEIDPEIKAKIKKINAETLRTLSQSGYKLMDEELEEMGFEKVEEAKEEIIDNEIKEEDEIKEEPKKDEAEITEEEKEKKINEIIKKSIENELKPLLNKALVKEETFEKKDVESIEIFHKKKLEFSSSIEAQAMTKLKTFFNFAKKVDKSIDKQEEKDLIEQYVFLMLPIYLKSMKEQTVLLQTSRKLENNLNENEIEEEAKKQAELSGKKVVETLKKETEELDSEKKEEYYNNREEKIKLIAINEVHEAIGIATLMMFKENKVPYKKWRTIGDERVCQFCKAMDGVVIKTGDKYWGKNETMVGLEGGTLSFDYKEVSYSQLHGRCRCTLEDIYVKPDVFIDYKGQNKSLEISRKIDKGFKTLEEENKKLKEKNEKDLIKLIDSL